MFFKGVYIEVLYFSHPEEIDRIKVQKKGIKNNDIWKGKTECVTEIAGDNKMIKREREIVCVCENVNNPESDGVCARIKRYGDMTGEAQRKSIRLLLERDEVD